MITQIFVICILAVKLLLATISIFSKENKGKRGAVIIFGIVDLVLLVLLYTGGFFDPLFIRY